MVHPDFDEELDLKTATSEEQFLKAYKKREYPKPSLTVDIAVFRRAEEGLEALMIRRGNYPFKGCWALPGGFTEPGEDVVDAARRELEEETGISDIPIEVFGIYGTPGRDPRGWTVSGGYCALVDSSLDVKAGDDAAEAQWCLIREKSNNAFADGTRGTDGASGSDVAPSGDMVELEITCGNEDVLMVRFERVAQRFEKPRARVVASDGFAFDHALLLADAYLKVC